MRRGVLLGAILALAVSLAGCAGQKEEPQPQTKESTAEETVTEAQPAADAQPETVETAGALQESTQAASLVFTMHFVDPASSPYAQGGEEIARLVQEATDGRIQIEVLSGGVLGGERDTIEMAMENELDIATCANSVLTNYIPQMNILDQAYLWKNAEEAHAAVDGTLGELIRNRAQTLGLHVIGFEESGFRNTFSIKPIRSISDFAGVTIRTMENKYHQAAFEAFGAAPVALAYTEVFDALKDGRVDACENATANCLNSGYYEITKNVTNTQHAFVYIILCMSEDAWNRIPEELRDPFLEAVQQGVAWERERLNEANAQATEELKKLGVSFYDIDIEELQAAYRKKAEENGFVFDREWQEAVDDAIAQAAAQPPEAETAAEEGVDGEDAGAAGTTEDVTE